MRIINRDDVEILHKICDYCNVSLEYNIADILPKNITGFPLLGERLYIECSFCRVNLYLSNDELPKGKFLENHVKAQKKKKEEAKNPKKRSKSKTTEQILMEMEQMSEDLQIDPEKIVSGCHIYTNLQSDKEIVQKKEEKTFLQKIIGILSF